MAVKMTREELMGQLDMTVAIEQSERAEKNENSTLTCAECDFVSSYPLEKARHVLSHYNEGYAKTCCGKTFTTLQGYKTHIAHSKNHPQSDRQFTHVCGQSFASEQDFKDHKTTCKIECDKCGNYFWPRGFGKHHSRCDGSGFSRPDKSAADKRLACDICGNFYASDRLYKHVIDQHADVVDQPQADDNQVDEIVDLNSDIDMDDMITDLLSQKYPNGIPADKLDEVYNWKQATIKFLEG